jgi:hypothetical protein
MLLAVGVGIVGCAGAGPRVCTMAEQPHVTIGFQGSDKAVDDHIYFSKEASSGGGGISSGGCGCN